ncbi:MAG: hypothetical protein LBI42_14690 [Chitinispirillales bacterium]|jgi:hypothetical protein|nr:hypothetical protein [Chitinispirillales bacterium]
MREQELSYLRGELNQLINFSNENSGKTISQIFLMWVGALALCGAAKDFFELSIIITGGIIFISNIVLYFGFQKDRCFIDDICRISSYITIFYENRINKNREDNIFWEITNFEFEVESEKSNGMKKHRFSWSLKMREYKIMAFLTAGLILIWSYCFFTMVEVQSMDKLAMFAFYALGVTPFCFSIFLICWILKNETLSYKKIKKKWLYKYLEYAIDNGYYTNKKEIENSFGEVFFSFIVDDKLREKLDSLSSKMLNSGTAQEMRANFT